MTLLPRGLAAAWRTAQYNLDWLPYLRAHWAPAGDETLLTFRLRNGQTVDLRGSMRGTLNEIYLHRVYDVPGVDLTSCRHVFDFGANMGVFSLYVAARAPAAAIASFEPATANFAILQRNLASNGVRAQAYRMAVSTASGPRRLSLAGHAGEYALDRGADRFEIVECADLAKVFSLTGAPTCDFLKMDVEGEELAILLESSLDLLRRIRVMALEWHHPEAPLVEVRAHLEAAGFRTIVDRVGYAKHQVMLKACRV